MAKKKKNNKSTVWIVGNIIALPLSLYFGGIFAQLFLGKAKFNAAITGGPVLKVGVFDVFSFMKENLGVAIISVLLAQILLNLAIFYLKYSVNKTNGIKDAEHNFTQADNDTYGSAGWMIREKEEEKLGLYDKPEDTGEIILGLDSDTNEIITIPEDSKMNHHIAVFGASGTRKSRCFVRNHMFQIVRRGESMVLTDPSGELFEGMSPYLRDSGYNVKVLNLVNLKHSDSWNCLKEIIDEEGKINDVTAQIFASVIIQNTGGKNGNDFWADCEMNLLKALCLLVLITPKIPDEKKSMSEVYNLLTTKKPIELDREFDELAMNDETQACKAAYNIYRQAGDNVKGGVVIGLGSRLQVFQSSIVRQITTYEEISLEKLGTQKSAYFCITSDQQSAFDFLAVLFYSMLFIKLVDCAQVKGKQLKLPVTVNFILDEFPNIGAIPDFTKKISTVRKYGINLSVIFQNIAQLQNRYPNGQWEEILGNCDTQIFLGCSDNTTAKFISDNAGIVTVEVQSKALGKEIASPFMEHNYKESHSIGKRALMTPDEVKCLNPDTEILFIRGEHPLKAQKFDFSLHPEAKRLIDGRVVDYSPEWTKKDNVAFNFGKKKELAGSAQEKYESQKNDKKPPLRNYATEHKTGKPANFK